ncbi:hypothetical protein [Flavobacterium sp. SOK18b]|uniref:hypothetical protein n=1 Tax=Flavobacterium sp. SOK18b TaxID=797900 RepID=UPI00351D6F04
MKIKNTLLLVLFMMVQSMYSQDAAVKEIRGKIAADSVAVDRINIVNITTEKATTSDANGFFTIPVKEGDILVFTAVNLEGLRKKIEKQDLEQTLLLVKMNPKSIVLREVIVNDNSISAESLRIIPYGQKKYTPAERKMYTATSGGGIDGLLNTISGRKAMLKKEMIVEKKEQLLARFANFFEDKYYVETLEIPQEHILGFQYYCVDDVDFAAALAAKNKWKAMFLISKLAQNYNEIIALETK